MHSKVILRSVLTLLFFVFVVSSLFSDTTKIDPAQYIVKAGDIFIIQSVLGSVVPDTTIVLPTGVLSLFPVADTVMVAGLTLDESYMRINQKIGSRLGQRDISDRILVQFAGVSPIRFHVLGAVTSPGEFISPTVLTLHQALRQSRGLILTASRKVRILRNGEVMHFDLDNYYADNDITQNPLIMHDDVILVNMANKYVKVFTNTESENHIESIEFGDSNYTVSEVLSRASIKYAKSNYDVFTVERDEEFFEVDANFVLHPFDNLFVHSEELYIYVTGYVVRPGHYQYNGSQRIDYYISRSGGVNIHGSRNRMYLIRKGESAVRYRDQVLQPGDTIFVPEGNKSIFLTYLTPVATVFSLLTSTYLIMR